MKHETLFFLEITAFDVSLNLHSYHAVLSCIGDKDGHNNQRGGLQGWRGAGGGHSLHGGQHCRQQELR